MACPAVAWGTTVVVEVTGAAERVAVVELVPVGAVVAPPVAGSGAKSTVATSPSVANGVESEPSTARFKSSTPSGGYSVFNSSR